MKIGEKVIDVLLEFQFNRLEKLDICMKFVDERVVLNWGGGSKKTTPEAMARTCKFKLR